MKSLINYPVKVFATGFVVLVLLSLPLFWARFLCEMILRDIMLQDTIDVSPSGLVPTEIENDPNVARPSHISAGMDTGAPSALGIVDYFAARSLGGRHSNIHYHDKHYENMLYFDKKIGQLVYHYTYEVKTLDNKLLRKKVQLYAGPEGISETQDKNLGRFITPIDARKIPQPSQTSILYDKKLRRFFNIKFNERVVVKGPKLGKDDSHKPAQIGRLTKNTDLLHLYWNPPQVKVTDEDKKKEGYLRSSYKPAIKHWFHNAGQFLLVLDESGRIDLLDRQTLEFAGTAGYLPAPETFFPSKRSVTPKDLLSYEVLPVAFTTDKKYRGMCVAGVSREGTAMGLVVFDEKGKLIKRDYTRATVYIRYAVGNIPSSRAIFWNVPRTPALTVVKYLAENLQPPVLNIASYFTADNFEAAAGHRALFILPNSFVAMKGRDVSEGMAGRLPSALLLMLPSIILAILLTWRVSKDAAAVGLSENAKLLWVIGTIAFGLTAYITYRLTRPKITLVTCTNCGKLRRPDMARCHRCGSKWHIPELTPPTWRVVDKQN